MWISLRLTMWIIVLRLHISTILNIYIHMYWLWQVEMGSRCQSFGIILEIQCKLLTAINIFKS